MFYKLDGRKPVPCAGREWVEWYEAAVRSGQRLVAYV